MSNETVVVWYHKVTFKALNGFSGGRQVLDGFASACDMGRSAYGPG